MALDVTSLFDRRANNRWDRVAVGDLLERNIWSAPNKPAIVGWEGAYSGPQLASLSYQEADAIANRVANGLAAAGLERGDRVVMVCENSVDAYVFKLGVAKSGMVVSCLNPALASDVVVHLLRELEPRFAVVDAELWHQVERPFAEAKVEVDVTVEIGGGPVAGSRGLGEWLEEQLQTDPDVPIHGDDIWEILYTSGTTAMPKGVMLSHTSSTLAAHSFALTLTRGVPLENDLVVVSFLPMTYHIGHQIFALPAFATGGTFVIGRRPDPAAMADCLERVKATAVWAGSPAMLAALLATCRQHHHDLSALTTAVYGWAALPPPVLDGLHEFAPNLSAVGIFGQTEAISCHRFWVDRNEELWRETSPVHNYVGVPSPMLASRVVDLDDAPLDGTVNVPGEAVYRSPVMTAGYYRNETATREAFRDGWFHSGDSCVYDATGQRIMVDRFKDIVKTGGENVSTMRVESVLMQHPGVAKAAVIGVPDQRWGEAVTAVVVPTGDGVTVEELLAFARARLAGFETPKRIDFVEALPETVGGKIMKYRLRAQYRGTTDDAR